MKRNNEKHTFKCTGKMGSRFEGMGEGGKRFGGTRIKEKEEEDV